MFCLSPYSEDVLPPHSHEGNIDRHGGGQNNGGLWKNVGKMRKTGTRKTYEKKKRKKKEGKTKGIN